MPLAPGGLSTPGGPAVDGGGGRAAEAKVSAMVWQSSNVAVKWLGTFFWQKWLKDEKAR